MDVESAFRQVGGGPGRCESVRVPSRAISLCRLSVAVWVERNRAVGAGSESDSGGSEENDDGYGGGFGDSNGVGCGVNRVPGGRITGGM